MSDIVASISGGVDDSGGHSMPNVREVGKGDYSLISAPWVKIIVGTTSSLFIIATVALFSILYDHGNKLAAFDIQLRHMELMYESKRIDSQRQLDKLESKVDRLDIKLDQLLNKGR